MRYFILFLLSLLAATAVSAGPADRSPEHEEVLALLQAGQDGEALAAARAWMLAHPDDPEALLLLAALQENADDVTGALESLDSAYFLTRDPQVLVRKGTVYARSGQMDRAQELLRKLVATHDTSVPAHLGLARVMIERGEYEEARAAIEAALYLAPQSPEAKIVLGRLNLLTGHYSDARTLLEQAVQQSKDNAEGYLWLGRLYAEGGQTAQAQEAWRHYLTLAPADAEAWVLAHNLFPTRARTFGCTGYRPTFSRQGDLMAYIGRTDSTNVYLGSSARPEVGERLYEAKRRILSLDFSPDGKHLLCRTYDQQTVDGKTQYTYALAVVETKSGGASKTVYEGRYAGQPSWGPDSGEIYFDAYVPGKGRALVSVPLTGGEPTVRLAPQAGESFYGCSWLPDGKRLLLQRWMQTEREYQLVLCDPTARSQDRVLAHSPQPLDSATLSPRGDYVFYCRRLGQPSQWNLMALSLQQPGLAHPLGLRSAAPWPPALLPDQQHMVMYAGSSLMLYDLTGVAPVPPSG